jgi:hypothetical protein
MEREVTEVEREARNWERVRKAAVTTVREGEGGREVRRE